MEELKEETIKGVLDEITISTEYKHLRIREITDSGAYHRRVLKCDQTLAEDEHQEVKDKAEKLWTDSVKASWATLQAEQEAERNPE